MIRTKLPVACFAAAVLVGSCATLAVAEPEAPPAPIDWRDFIDTDMDEGDHVVGEELCAAPDTLGADPGSFVLI